MTTRTGTRPSKRHHADGPWRGPTRHYDLVKEFVIALVVTGMLTALLATVLSSPDDHAISLRQWANADPADFVTTTVTELGGTSDTATYGPPYNDSSQGQHMGPVTLQKWGGIREPVDPATDFVLGPLKAVPDDPRLTQALRTYTSASAAQQLRWAGDYDDALSKAPGNDPAKVAPGDYGPVPVLTGRLLRLAQTGGLDSALVGNSGFYTTNYTKPLLFLADGGYFAGIADSRHLSGDQWGMMNETGNYPGQAWLWLYTFWYQIPSFAHSDNADAWIWALMALLSLILICVPFIPGLRSVPRLVGLHRLIWRRYHRDHPPATATQGPAHPPDS
ncbi:MULTISPECIES: hypothetical protein [Amycolatopsis]|uniref:Uncharacterized protein n=1 Tax=Amycolatopsis alkalitolerans TaxID=2547244 RepID=A0A5C4LTT9_9PSEU|nr:MULTISPECIES: hypothetical protein [Amycolatopsis]TNC22062.1 hypothetical protein FG385_26265 [Amycolatopsis alkalitolerans]